MSWRNILQEVGADENTEYWETTEEKRKEIISRLWDIIYGDIYKDAVVKHTEESIETQYEILVSLHSTLHSFEKEEEYELCDVVQSLINITEDKIQEIDFKYAINNTKTKR